MLYKNEDIILPKTLRLLNDLQNDSILDNFTLAGGTALALQIGHRHSIDLDFFTQEDFDTEALLNHLSSKFDFITDNVAKNTLSGVINGVKIDLLKHGYPWIYPVLEDDNLRLASIEDIAAMKINAIVHSGKRQKDFYDIYFLLEFFNLSKILDFYESKYKNAHKIIGIKALTWFKEIDFLYDPPSLKEDLTFEKVKARIREATEFPERKFS
ncbi:MAG: nucleotidyl transferase AbiEii/AbiGii toxin family protein [Saprospiraceae bacterium]